MCWPLLSTAADGLSSNGLILIELNPRFQCQADAEAPLAQAPILWKLLSQIDSTQSCKAALAATMCHTTNTPCGSQLCCLSCQQMESACSAPPEQQPIASMLTAPEFAALANCTNPTLYNQSGACSPAVFINTTSVPVPTCVEYGQGLACSGVIDYPVYVPVLNSLQ